VTLLRLYVIILRLKVNEKIKIPLEIVL